MSRQVQANVHIQPQVIARNQIIHGNIYTGRVYSPQAYKRQRIIATCIPLIFLIMGVVCLALGVTLMGAMMLGLGAFFLVFAILIIRRSRMREQQQNAQMAVIYNQASMQPPSQFYPSQHYPAQLYPAQTSAPPHPPQTYNFPSSFATQGVQSQQFNGVQSMQPGPHIEPPPPSYDEAMTSQNK